MTERPDVVPIEDLSAKTIRALIDRVQTWSTGFASRIDREAELDALWSLADIARLHMRLGAGDREAGAQYRCRDLPLATVAELSRVADAIVRAHDAHASGSDEEAVRWLVEAAEVAERCAPSQQVDSPGVGLEGEGP